MASRPIDAQIDRLYQLPLDEFTSARNALAKASVAHAAEIRALQKPPVAAWAINQVYWRDRPASHALTAAAAALRTAHTLVVSGKRADLRAAGKLHEEALDAFLKAAIGILRDTNQPATDATRQAIATTLRALPASTDPPGRLTQVLQPTGFELMTGLSLGSSPARPVSASSEKAAKAAAPPATRDSARAKALTQAKEAAAAAIRAERAAEQNARREEFEAAKTIRDAERATSELATAREALEAAQEAVETAEAKADAAVRKKEAAARRVRETADALASARVRSEAAQAAVARG